MNVREEIVEVENLRSDGEACGGSCSHTSQASCLSGCAVALAT